MRTVQRYSGRANIAPNSSRTVKKRPISSAPVDSRSTNTPSATSPAEVWKPFPSYEDQYEISSRGQVASIHTGLIIRPGIDQEGRAGIWIKLPGSAKKRHLSICHAVATAFLDNPHRLPAVRHRDGNLLNDCVNNLQWVLTTDGVVSTPSIQISHE